MTLLSFVNDVLGETAVDPITSVISTSSDRAKKLFALAKRALNQVSEEYDWPHLVGTTPYSFDTIPLQYDYALPADFDKLISDTPIDEDMQFELRGGVSYGEWLYIAARGTSNSVMRFLINGYGSTRKLLITPTPQVAQTMAYFYRSSYLAVDSGGIAKSTFTDDSDTCKVPETAVALDFKWRYLRSRGFDYAEEFREAREYAAKKFAEALAQPTIEFGGKSWESPLSDGFVPDTGYGA